MIVLKQKKPYGFWKDISNRRAFIESLILKKNKNLDLLTKDSWKQIEITHQDVSGAGGASLIQAFNGSFSELMSKTFPELEIQQRKNKPCGYWKDLANQQSFFLELATKHLNLDITEDCNWWEKITKENITLLGGRSLLSYYNN